MGADAGVVDTRSCQAEGRAAIQPASPNVADSDLHRGRLFLDEAQTVFQARLSKEAALSRRRRAPAQIGRPRRRQNRRGPAQHRGGPRSIRPSRRWQTQAITEAACHEAAQAVSSGRLTKEESLLRRRLARTRKKHVRRRRGIAALPSRGAGREPAGLPERGRLRFAPGPPVHRRGPNSVLVTLVEKGGPLAPPAGARNNEAPLPTA